MMKARFAVALTVLMLTLILFGRSASAQSGDTVDYQINALRADLKADKAEIISEVMQFKAQEGKAFWPVYRQYDKELSEVNDELVDLVKTYAKKFGTVSDAD